MILTPDPKRRVFAYPAPVDLRKGYDGLFVNEPRKLCKVLVWDGSGLCIFAKRLTLGTFAKLWREDGTTVRLSQRELAMFIEGSTFFARRPAIAIGDKKTVVSDRAT